MMMRGALPGCESCVSVVPLRSSFPFAVTHTNVKEERELLYVCARTRLCLCARACERSARFLSKPTSWFSVSNE